MLGKRQPNFIISLIIIKVIMDRLERIVGKFHTHYCLDGHSDIKDWDFEIFEQCKTQVQLRKEKPFGNIDLKPFTRQILMKRRGI